ncbi:M28 family peptidase [Chitinophaga horti]|uniref:M28 family peptidase n=1 Tax=Chitinophaga horti TaxID=2920382 RepID=A0ABY6IZ07_9BACT|nr:M28 family peptidase [Chitinophaga horti]UYQ92515.1 M28 family peptidase [Chitinophaga horti]
MRTFTLLTCLLGAGISACAQAPALSKPGADTYGNSITAADLKKHLYFIAGDKTEGRETATKGQRVAAAYIAAHFKKLGLKPGVNGKWEQFFSMVQDTVTSSTLSVGRQTFTFGKDYVANVRETAAQDINNASLVFAGYGISTEEHDDYKNLGDLNDKVVVVLEGEPRDADGNYPLTKSKRPSPNSEIKAKARAAGGKGVKALFVISSRLADPNMAKYLVQSYTKSRVYMKENLMTTMEYIPNSYLVTPTFVETVFGKAVADSMIASVKAGRAYTSAASGPVNLTFKKGQIDNKSSNVLGYLEGTDKKDEILFVTAHYDHLGKHDGKIFYGADDDGSGTVAVMEMAEAFAKAKKAGKGPRRSIVFMTVSGEEKGLLGSKYYTDNPIYPLANTVADLNIDMIGRIDPQHASDSNYVYVIGDDKLSSDLRPISELANNTYTKLDLDYRYNDPNDPNRFYYRSDHYMFAQHKIPIIFYFNGVHADYHKETDTVEKISYQMLQKRARLVFYTAWEIANREDRLKVDRNEK